MSVNTLRVAVAGASGYAGGELLRLLAQHPGIEIATVTAHSQVGVSVTAAHGHLQSLGHLVFKETTEEVLKGHDVVFFALPHGASGELANALAASGDDAVLIDCGADFRLESAAAWQEYYGGEHAGTWTYGMPELLLANGAKQREALRTAKRIAVPGCNVSAITLGIMAASSAGLIDAASISATLAVGLSGAGKAPKTHLLASEIHGAAVPYAVGGTHRHIPEVKQNLQKSTSGDVNLSFTPVLVPMSRGILATITAPIAKGVTDEAVRAAYTAAFADEAYVRLMPSGQVPNTQFTLGANTCLVQVAVDAKAGQLIVIAALDNLVKGTAGAAVQSMNLACGLDEHLGLSVNGVAP